MRQTVITIKLIDAGGETRVDISGGCRQVDAQGSSQPVEINLPQLVSEGIRGLALMVREFEPKAEGPKLMVARGIPAMN